MDIQSKKLFETIFAASLAAVLGFVIAIYTNQPQSFNVFARSKTINENTIVSTPPPQKPTIVSQISPDGTKKIVRTILINSDNTQTFFFSVTDGSGNNGHQVFQKTLDMAKTITIPFNAWSPDNKYFFIQEQIKDGPIIDVMTLDASGKPFSNEEQYLDVTNIFMNRNTGNNFIEATGWASETLIIINTKTPTGEKGPSYWFEVPSKAVIQLSTDF